jgi:hypothetical protein
MPQELLQWRRRRLGRDAEVAHSLTRARRGVVDTCSRPVRCACMWAWHANDVQSIDLTQLPVQHHAGSAEGDSPTVEYSSREVSPPALLVKQLVRAYDILLLHHGMPLSGMLDKHKRTKFCNILDKYWTRFASSWDVLLHGSPAVDIYNGIKLAAGGELGMGVGEEEWGSGERLVLEYFVQKTEGLVDFMVSRFGEPSPHQDPKKPSNTKDPAEDTEPWIGSGSMPTAADGIVFSGVGALTRKSLRDVSQWIETIYTNGDQAYGVGENPTTDRKKRRRRVPPVSTSSSEPVAQMARLSNKPNPSIAEAEPTSAPPLAIPPDLVKNVENSLHKASSAVDASEGKAASIKEARLASLADSEIWMKYLTLGYGTAWGSKKTKTVGNTSTQAQTTENVTSEAPMRFVDPEPDVDHEAEKLKAQIQQENIGYFAIGLKGDLGDGDPDESNDEDDWNHRTVLRTVHVELTDEGMPETPGTGDEDPPQLEKTSDIKNGDGSRLRRLRPVIYVVMNRKPLHRLLLLIANPASTLYLYISIPPWDRGPHGSAVLPPPAHLPFTSTSALVSQHVPKQSLRAHIWVLSPLHNLIPARFRPRRTANL